VSTLKSNPARPSIFEFSDYRQYLRKCLEMTPSTRLPVTKRLGLRGLSRLAGFRSPSYLKGVIDGDRNLSLEGCSRIASALNLNRFERQHLEKLVRFAHARNWQDKASEAASILESHTVVKIHPLARSRFRYYSKWYFIAIREAIGLPGFVEDPHLISRCFLNEISPAEVRTALDDLAALGLVKRKPDGRLEKANQNLRSGSDPLNQAAQVDFLKRMMSLGSVALDRIRREQREISALTLSCDISNIEEYRKIILETKERLLALSNQEDRQKSSNSVIQINFQMFPLMRETGSRPRGENSDE